MLKKKSKWQRKSRRWVAWTPREKEGSTVLNGTWRTSQMKRIAHHSNFIRFSHLLTFVAVSWGRQDACYFSQGQSEMKSSVIYPSSCVKGPHVLTLGRLLHKPLLIPWLLETNFTEYWVNSIIYKNLIADTCWQSINSSNSRSSLRNFIS